MRIASIFVLALCLFTFSCEKNSVKKLPDCIQELIDSEDGENLKTIQYQKVNDELHYWLNTDSRHGDGIEYYVNASCETECYIIGDPDDSLPECLQNYHYDEWKVIWKQK